MKQLTVGQEAYLLQILGETTLFPYLPYLAHLHVHVHLKLFCPMGTLPTLPT